MILKTIKRVAWVRRGLSSILDTWIQNKVLKFSGFLTPNSRILDLGSGNCLIADHLMNNGFQVVPIDIKDLSIVERIKPMIYDGTTLPFETDTFDTVLLLTVLHHSDDPIQLISEAKRVAKNVVIIEDTYNHVVQKLATQFVDFIINFGHSKMTYQNKTEADWEDIFSDYDLEVVSKQRKPILLFFQQTTYFLKKV